MPDKTDRIHTMPQNCTSAIEALALRVSSLEHEVHSNRPTIDMWKRVEHEGVPKEECPREDED